MSACPSICCRLRAWRSAKLHPGHGLCGVIGEPILHSRGPAFHNPRFQRAFKDLVYLPLTCAEAEEAVDALDALGILGLSITAPLKLTLPAALGLQGPLNTLWRRAVGEPWQGANTDAEALGQALSKLAPGPVLLLGEGGVSRKISHRSASPNSIGYRRDSWLAPLTGHTRWRNVAGTMPAAMGWTVRTARPPSGPPTLRQDQAPLVEASFS